MLARQDLVVICGKSGFAKNRIVLDLMLKLATGRPYMRRFKPLKPLVVVYATKDNSGALEAYLKGFNYGKARSLARDNFTVIKTTPNLTGGVDEFVAAQQGYPPIDLLVINPLEFTLDCNLYNWQSADLVVGQLRELANRLNCAIIVIHSYENNAGAGWLNYQADVVIECNNHEMITVYGADLDVNEFYVSVTGGKVTWSK